jgi:arylsulfatase A-like enzyme
MGQHMFVDASLPDREYTKTAYQRYLRKYLRCVRGVDDKVGRLLAHLQSTGELDNTVVIYTSDQGFMLGEHDYIDKRWMYEESIRMPFLVRYPGVVKPGSRSGALINNTDFAPTMLDLAQGKAPGSMQGRSFVSILRGSEPAGWRTATYYRYWMHMAHHDNPAHYGIRTKDYKLIFFYGLPLDVAGALKNPTQPGWELYDSRKDPAEIANVYGKPEYLDIGRKLKTELLRIKAEVGDTDERYPELMEARQKYWE